MNVLYRPIAIVVPVGLLFVAGCKEEDPGMLERIILLEAEQRDQERVMKRLEKEKRTLTAEVEKAEAGGGGNIDVARANFSKEVSRLETELGAGVTGGEITGPGAAYAYAAQVVVDGRAFPVKADAEGRWVFPGAAVIRERLGGGGSGRAPAAQTRQPTDVMGAGRTEQIDWGDAPRQPQQRQRQPAQQPTQRKPSGAKQVMPSDRDITIDFDN